MSTAAYMAPEQAKGRNVDKRADVWAFGVLLYEMLTGQMLFSGETTSETIAAVMMRDPDWKALPSNTPARLRDLIRRCLVKEPRNRVRDIGDVRIVIEEVQSGGEAGGVVPETLARRRSKGLVGIAAVLCLVMAFLLGTVSTLFLNLTAIT